LSFPSFQADTARTATLVANRQTERETERQTDRKRERQTERETDRQTDRERDRETDRERERQTERETEVPAKTLLSHIDWFMQSEIEIQLMAAILRCVLKR